ncbi:hypothetical protein, conserved [Babesia ovata]|uniref:C3H1-type domain-containing protein n=1 Tax=Babesia ovata TaxID=189622 RepID=A0A2H6KKA4_9APIC|nr:uncharacterized protein BOVATA_049130 [Babesia ovata]GBE63420.1 hypothetical protein, conserved [Babesia ovata]
MCHFTFFLLLLIAYQSPKNASEIDKLNKDLQSHNASKKSLDTLQKLCGYANKIPSSQNNPRDLLDKLCTGIQTFLGYDNKSNGYTGSGIVYSDLDRLCDGVVAFLHGVLESVKGDDSVEKYDVNEHFKTLPAVLKRKMYSGSRDFEHAIQAVAESAKRWNEELEKKVGNFKNVLNDIQTRNFDYINDSLKKLNNIYGDSLRYVPDLLQACCDEAKNLHDVLMLGGRYYNDLDRSLKNKLKDSVSKIEVEVEKFVAAARNEELRNLLVFIQGQINQLGDNVNERVKGRLEQMAGDVNVKFEAQIHQPTIAVNSALTTAKTNLDTWIEKSKQAVNTAIEKVAKIMKILEGQNGDRDKTAEKENVTNAAKKLQEDANKLWMAVTSAKDGLNGLSESIKSAVRTFEGVYKSKIKEVAKKVHGGVQSALGKLENLHREVKAGLTALETNKINPAIGKVIKDLEAAVRNAGEAVSPTSSSGDATYIVDAFNGDKNGGGGKILEHAPSLAAWAGKGSSNGLKNAINKLHRAGDSDDFEAFQNFLKEISENHGSANFFTPLIADLKKQVTAAMQELINGGSFAAVFTTFHYQTTTNSNGTLKKDIEDIREDLTAGITPIGLTQPGEYKVNPAEFTSYNSEHTALQEKINEIETKGLDHLTNAKDTSSTPKAFSNTTFTNQFGQFEIRLNEFTAAVKELVKKDLPEKDKDSVSAYLGDLQNMISYHGENEYKLTSDVDGSVHSLTKIKEDIIAILGIDKRNSNPTGNVADILEKATNFYDEVIKKQAVEVIDFIKQLITQEVEDKTKEIQDSAKRQYHDKINKMLAAMKKAVNSNVSIIKSKIDGNLNAGIKGLLRNMNDWLKEGINIDPLKTPGQINDMMSLASKISPFFDKIVAYAKDQLREQAEIHSHVKLLFWVLRNLFTGLIEHSHFSNEVSHRLATLSEKVSNLQPLALPDAGRPVLGALKDGLQGFVKELQKQYVSRYSLQEWKPEDEGKYAKVCLTIMEGLQKDMYDLQNECKSGGKNKWHEKKMCLIEQDKKTQQVPNDLGHWFQNRGFRVPKDKDNQNGELNKERNGEYIFGKITENIAAAHSIPVLKTWKIEKYKIASDRQNNIEISLFDIADFLRDVFRKYYAVCQHEHILSPKAPSNIYHMLQWLAGLRWNHMYDKLSEHFKELFEKPKDKKEKLYKELSDTDLSLVGTSPIDSAGTTTITPKELKGTLEQVCLYSRKVLITFLGHGHADGIYAVDFSCNSDNLMYPTSAASCLDMLEDILNRVFYKLNFLWAQCRNGPKSGGWQECWYGRHIGGSSFQCNDVQCHNQACKLNANQGATQNANQICNQHPICGVKSPLQSFLEDGLSGFLPHSFKTPGCKLECTLSNHRGIPCQTPMGFTDISNVASRTQKGEDLRAELAYFCGTGSNLNKLCSYLSFLLRRPPQTLGDMFAFYHQFLKNWTAINIKLHKHDAFIEAVEKANFGQTYTDLHPTSIQVSKTHSDKHDKGDLFSLTDCYHKTNSGLPCGKYLQPLYLDIRDTFSEKHTANYLSWIVYLTETFYDLLKKLYDDCCSNCNNPGSRCYDKCCSKDCKVKSAYDAENSSETLKNAYHEKQCHSIVKCPNMHPTLHKFGFTFWSANKLSGQDKEARQKRTCKDFCQALKRVIGKNCVLVDLIHDITNSSGR